MKLSLREEGGAKMKAKRRAKPTIADDAKCMNSRRIFRRVEIVIADVARQSQKIESRCIGSGEHCDGQISLRSLIGLFYGSRHCRRGARGENWRTAAFAHTHGKKLACRPNLK
jgi:ketopantoate hydroxymethyltransferase